jgi:AraC-like DNA-binding protein
MPATKNRFHSSFRYFPVSARDRRWGLWLTTAGESRIPPHAPYPPAGHPGSHQFDWHKGRVLREYQVVYISAGQGILQTRCKRWQIRSGDVFILFPGVWHTYRPNPRTGWNEHWLGCDGAIARDLVKNRFLDPHKPVLGARHEELLLSAFAGVMDAVHANRPALQQVMAGLALYILSLLYSSQQPGQSSRRNVGAAIHEAMRRMTDSHGQTQIDIRALARELNVSYTWFRRMFTQHTGLSPHQYWLQIKISRARTLLTDTDLTVKEIAYQSGFASEHYFCRLFKAKTGITPVRWRRLPSL